MEERQRHHATAKNPKARRVKDTETVISNQSQEFLLDRREGRRGGGAAGPRASWMVSNRNGFLALFLAASLVMTRPDHAAFKRAFKKAAKER